METPVLTLWSFKHYSVQSLTLKVFSWWCRLHMNNELCCDRSSKSQKATLFSSWVGDAQNESMTRTVGRWFQLVSFHTSTSFVTDPINELEPRAFSLAEVCCERCCLRVKIGHVTRRYLNLLKLWPHSQKTKFWFCACSSHLLAIFGISQIIIFALSSRKICSQFLLVFAFLTDLWLLTKGKIYYRH